MRPRPAPPSPPLISAGELREIAERALEVLRSPEHALPRRDDDREASDRHLDRRAIVRCAVQALRFCAHAAGLLGDASLIPLLSRAFAEPALFGDVQGRSSMEEMTAALSALLSAGAPVDHDVRALARDSDARVRQAVAAGLSPTDAAALDLLETLSADPVVEVREAAGQALRVEREVPWWKGKFASDPIPRMAPDDAARVKDALAQLAVLLDTPSYDRGKGAELARLARTLPDPLAVELAEATLSALADTGPTAPPALGTVMLERQDGFAALERVIARWSVHVSTARFGLPGFIASMIVDLADPERLDACRALLARAVAVTERAGGERPSCSAAWMMATAAAQAWPPGRDLNPVLDAILVLPEAPDGESDEVAFALEDALRRPGGGPESILKRAIEARLAGYPGRWSPLALTMDAMLDRAPLAELRAAAERALASELDATVAWGLKRLLGPLHKVGRDPPRPVLVRRFFADPRLRRVLVGRDDLAARALPLLREELREGKLEWPEAEVAMRIIDHLYGGLADSGYFQRRARTPAAAEEQLRKQRAEVRAFLGPRKLQGPPTAEEWVLYRAARARQALRGYDVWRVALEILPQGPWTPEDRALLEQALEVALNVDRAVALPIAIALAAKPSGADLPLFDELLRVSGEDAQVRRCRRVARERLGLAASPEPGPELGSELGGNRARASAPNARAAQLNEWMDQEEDEGD